jgi:hypothetical protein
MQKAELELHDIRDIVNTSEWRWKRWDVRSDGRVFWQYTKNTKSGELWITWESALRTHDSIKKANRKQIAKDPEKHKLLNKVWREANRERHRENAKNYYQKNKKHVNEVKRKRRLKRRHSEPLFALKYRIRTLVGMAFKSRNYTKSSKTHEIIGCDWPHLKAHIESQFMDGMNWENRTDWHIDHIIPLASAKTQEDVWRLNHYSNLRPLWAIDNLKKGSTIPDRAHS